MKTDKYFRTIVLLFCCLMVISIPKETVSAAQPFFKSDERGVSLQYVPLGTNCNGWSDSQQIYGGEKKNVKWAMYKPEDLSGDTAFSNHFIGIQKINADAADPVTVIIENARIITDDGTIIPFSSFDGKYEITKCESNTQLCTDNTVSFNAEEIEQGYFCATISVQYNTKQESDSLYNLTQITGELPGDEFYQVEGNQIKLTDFSFDGTMCITGNDAQDTVELVIKGDCSINHLMIQCPVIIKRYAYGSLACQKYECNESGSVTFDSECNATKLVENAGTVSIEFDATKEDMTQGEIDEKNGTYNFSWRHRNSEWYQQALAMIAKNRTQAPQLHFVDENGTAVEVDRVELKLSDYDYLFGHGNHGVMLNDDGKLSYWENSNEELKGNVLIEYDAFGWESYDPSHQGEYNFETSSSGNTTFIKDGTKLLEENGITRVAQPIIYPAFGSMRYNSASTTMYDSIVNYIFSDDYTPEGFHQMIKEHITEEVKEYAGVVKVWAVVNEAFYSTDFFKLIYGSDGTGISKETIADVLTEKGVINGTNNEKLKALVSYLKEMDITPATETAKLIAQWAETAQAAWDSTITPDCGYTSDTLTLYYNDAVFKGYTLDAEGHYDYNLELIQALGKPETYPGNKVLIRLFGSQFSSWFGYSTSPQEVWEMLDETEAVGEKTLVTEFCYWLNHPYSEQGDNISQYGEDNPGYRTTGFLSKAEEEFAYDYAYYILTAVYAHENSKGFHSTSYPHGQIGWTYLNNKISPLGEAYNDLVMNEWNSSFTADVNGKTTITTEPLSSGTYTANITVGDKIYQQNIEIGAKNTDITITLEDPAGYITYALEEDSYSVSVQKGAFVFLPECPIKYIGNKSFLGWSEEKDGQGTIYKTGSKYVKQSSGEVILYPIFQETECITAVLYSDEQYSNILEDLGTFKNVSDLNEVLEGKTGYLQIFLERNTVLDALPGKSSLSQVRICNKEQNNYALSIEASKLTLQSDIVLAVNTQLLAKDVNLVGDSYKIILEHMTLSGENLTAEGIELICGKNLILDTNINRAKALYVNQNKTITEEDGNLLWDNVYGNSSLLVKGKLSNIGTLYMYGSSVYLEKAGSMEVDSIAGIYGDIYLQKRDDGQAGLTVHKTMKDMVWQIRLKVYETLNQKEWYNTELCSSIPCGTPLANLPKTTDEYCKSKLGFIINDNWETYDKKLYQDEILYYDDGSSVIEHLWETVYTEDSKPTCNTEGKKSIHCSVCEAVKNETSIPPTKEHQFSTEGICVTCGIHKGVIQNKNYPTQVVYGSKLPAPTAVNFVINSNATPAFKWFKGDVTQAETLPTEGDGVLESSVPSAIGSYTLVVTTDAVNGETNYTSAELRINVVIAEGLSHGTATITSTTAELSKSWDDLPVQTPTFTTSNETGTGNTNVSFEYKKITDTEYSTVPPSDAGSYLVRVRVAADMKYTEAVSEPVEFTISKVNPTYTKPAELRAECGDKLSTVSLSETGFEWADTDDILEAGSKENGYKVTKKANYVPEDTTNYNIVENIDLTITVTHVKDEGTKVEPTCEKKGSVTYKCKKCNQIMEVNEVDAAGHTWDKGKITKEATETATGIMTYSCKKCSKEKTEVIPKSKPKTPKKGEVVKDSKSNAKYKVTDITKNEVAYNVPNDKNVKTVTIPATVTINGFEYKVTTIADKAFSSCKKLTKVTLGKNVTSIEANAFSGCKKLTTVRMGGNVTTIGDRAFYKCTALKKVTIPSKVNRIGKQAFYGCKKLKTITIKTTKLSAGKVGSKALKGIYSKATIKVPKSKLTSYKKWLKTKGVSSKTKIKN